ncbi:2-oxo acid dehydrogenase subunit E2 [Sinisalibacter aestuarii]|uniref:Dihydrolipoamide acetyltransferase component of pyruvate dehydrogenase complex n=1 Tax=Sinisalibacter aestuarii TaxID=2949426 RepID=A0ABQ5LXT8_9RHOB|nr:2-oxo acid dehydrogenase subunit E2 [Sinisalibacter aestuarii]GKY89608.1 dihydrolipoamide acetyltransferase component of pyruvate dehydrogenase complex [Sinisalibacter aestuarii]
MSQIIAITLPKWGLEMSEGTVTAWHLAEGQSAEKGAELVDIETDKIVNSVELDQSGTLRRILVPEGEVAPVGALIAVMAEPAVNEAAIELFIAEYKPVDASFEPSEQGAEAAVAAPEPVAGATPPAGADLRATPLAKRVAEQSGVDLATVAGSGHRGKVTRDDVARASAPARSIEDIRAENATIHASPIARKFAGEVGLGLAGIAGSGRKGRVSLADAEAAAIRAGLWSRPAKPARGAGPAAAMPAETGSEQPFTGMRKSIARALAASKQNVPHFYTTVDLRIDALMDLRKGMNGSGGAKISVNDFLIRACGMALTEHPGVNVHVSENGVTLFERADISVAVAIDGGLITPVLRDAGQRGLRDIAGAAADLAARARARALTAEELKGGTFTLSNLGMFGVREFDAIINPPQGAILAVGGPRREAVEGPDGAVLFATMISATLSADHRAIDGALAAQFLATLRGLIEDPMRLLS